MTSLILSGMSSSPFVVLGPVFHVPVRASLALFYAVIWICVFANAGRGLFVATIARNLAQVSMSSLLVVGPIILLSGLWAPPEAMPAWLQLASAASPLRHFIDVSYGILLKGAGLTLLWDSVLAIGAIGVLIFTFGMWRFRGQFA